MKKAILFLLVVSTTHVFSQSITVEPHEYNVNMMNSTSSFGDLGTDITVRNISDNTIDIKVSRQIISTTQGTSNYFCWTLCYLPNTSVSPDAITFSAGQVEPSKFQVHFDNMNVENAAASIKYCAFDANNVSDSACAIVNFSVGTVGISSDTDKKTSLFSDFHPNPATTYASLDYSILPSQTAEIVVTDMLGTVVEKKVIQNKQGIVRLNVSNTPNGLYFANIYVDGKLDAIKRLLVSK